MPNPQMTDPGTTGPQKTDPGSTEPQLTRPGGGIVTVIDPQAPRHGRRKARDEQGITTAEYAVGTAAGAGFAALLFKMLTGGFGTALLKTLFDHVLSLLGIG